MKLTRKQKAFAQHLLNNPKDSATEAAAQAYDIKKRHTAEQIAHENLRKPDIQLYLNEHVDKAKNRIVTLVDSQKEEIALRASDSILDRTLGKATQRTEQTTTTVSLSLSLKDITES